jgi:hypothetical protein
MPDVAHAPPTTSPSPEVPYVAGFWRDPQAFKIAAQAARDAGHTQLQAYLAYPLHGIEEILGLERSTIGRPVFVACLVFFVLAYLMQYNREVTDFPMVYGGKPYHTWQLFVVVTLETGLLLGAVANLLLAFHTCRLVPNPFFKPMNPRLSDDTFGLALPTSPRANADQLVEWLKKLGAVEVEINETAGTATAAKPAEAAHV